MIERSERLIVRKLLPLLLAASLLVSGPGALFAAMQLSIGTLVVTAVEPTAQSFGLLALAGGVLVGAPVLAIILLTRGKLLAAQLLCTPPTCFWIFAFTSGALA